MNLSDFILMRALDYYANRTLFQVKREYSGGKLIYCGIAPRTAATSVSLWIICKYTYSGDDPTDDMTSAQGVKWDDRATIF